jgi:hypothetical protein
MGRGDPGVGGVDVVNGGPRRHVVDDLVQDRAGRLMIGAALEPQELDFVGHGRLSVRRYACSRDRQRSADGENRDADPWRVLASRL